MCWLCLVIGVVLGSIVTNLIVILRSSGATFLIDNSDPEKDRYKLNLGDLDKVSKKKLVMVRIKHAELDEDSQK